MTDHAKPAPNQKMPAMRLPTVDGGEIELGTAGSGNWQVAVIYRGRHCPICKTYLKNLNGLLDEFRGIDADVVAISADPQDRAKEQAQEDGWNFTVACDLSQEQMRDLGLYISEPRSEKETDRPFAEPALFVTNPDGNVQIIDISNAPFARPDMQSVLKGMKFIQKEGYPVRGQAA